ncbi:VP3 [Kadipiro virus]|uniref:VP3 n=1 Tax=Kadipiro virus TaxID=104580 RepID=Q9INI9_9REOV|nr:VP3 [Kadipiro virus]AAF78851.1 VP3 [Kadipiro virus]
MSFVEDDTSCVREFDRLLKVLEFGYSVSEDGTLPKTYNNMNDRIYYSLGDMFQSNYNNTRYVIPHGTNALFQKVGYFKIGTERANRTAVLRSAAASFANIIGVEPNGIKAISFKGNGFRLYDGYIYSCSNSPINDFVDHCSRRWKYDFDDERKIMLEQLVMRYKRNYMRMFDKINHINSTDGLFIAKIENDHFTSMFTSPRHVKLVDNDVIYSGHLIRAMAGSASIDDGRLKNQLSTQGLLMTHERYFLIGEAPGNHYSLYKRFMNKENCLLIDPRDVHSSVVDIVRHEKRFFTRADIMRIAEIAASNQHINFLLRIDIRNDKPHKGDGAYNSKWEDMVQYDNELTAELINSMPMNVTISAKLRPSYNTNNVMPILTRKFRVVPLPYLKKSTAEFHLFVPRHDLLNGTEIDDVSYETLINMSYEVCALKTLFGKPYNTYLMDMTLGLGVMNKFVKPMSNSIALYSYSNSSNSRYNSEEFKFIRDYLYTYPYSSLIDKTFNQVTHGRSYSDNTVNIYDECSDEAPLFIPIYSLPLNAKINYYDMRTVCVMDKDGLAKIGFKFSQPDNQMSTQIVKLVSFILKEICEKRNLSHKHLDDEIRSQVLENYFKDKSGIDYNIVGTTVMINDRLVSVSGHMQYILIGSVLGLPYGIKRYIMEIESNILNPKAGYERKSGSRVWHGFHSHYLAVDSALLYLTTLMNFKVEQFDMIKTSFNWIKIQLLDLASKYSNYLLVDERSLIS